MTNSSELLKTIADSPYAFPGGYQTHALTNDGECLCHKCCKEESKLILDSDGNDGWGIVALFIHWEGEPITCCNCYTEYSSEYGE